MEEELGGVRDDWREGGSTGGREGGRIGGREGGLGGGKEDREEEPNLLHMNDQYPLGLQLPFPLAVARKLINKVRTPVAPCSGSMSLSSASV